MRSIVTISIVVLMIACKSEHKKDIKTHKKSSDKEKVDGHGKKHGHGEHGHKKPPTFSQLLAHMDENKDGQLAKAEVKGPLSNDFDAVDTDKDGLISKVEFDKAPKPDRGQRHSEKK